MNRAVLIAIVMLILVVWFSAFVNACAPRPAFGGIGSFGPPIIIGGGGWNQGGWDRGSSSSSSPSKPSAPAPSRSSGGSVRGGGISGGSGGK